jgi:hypothetical protein
VVNGVYYRLASTSPTQIANTSSGPGTYLVRVASPSGQSQSYRLTRSM